MSRNSFIGTIWWCFDMQIASLTLLCIFCALPARAYDGIHHQQEPSVRVTGHAVVMTQPDQAQLDIGVVTEAKTAAGAANQNAQRVDRVIGELKKTLGQNTAIKTLSYSVSPNYRYPKEGGKPEITGYTASNIVRLTTERLSDVGKIIDAASQAGANTIHNLQYTLKDEKTAQSAALREAAENARAKAQTLAAALSLQVVGVQSVAENQAPEITPLRKGLATAEARAIETPIEPGTIEVRAEVVLEVIVAPK